MSAWLVPAADDPIGRTDIPIEITLDGEVLRGIAGQTLAGILISNGRSAWRTDSTGRPRGLFCGIGSCFDCLATVNDETDVRLCRRRARAGDAVMRQSRSES
ncbi:MAG TPA: (2Fe-2S)-binding protein [Mycobacterium sp.]|nr:(2Fe-2S)-binding protein [Mycobacterium sp.]